MVVGEKRPVKHSSAPAGGEQWAQPPVEAEDVWQTKLDFNEGIRLSSLDPAGLLVLIAELV